MSGFLGCINYENIVEGGYLSVYDKRAAVLMCL